MTKQLTEAEFRNTFGDKMTDVTETALPVVDIWQYVEELVQEKIIDSFVYEKNLVEAVYRNDTLTFDHVLLPTEYTDVFIVLVVDLINATILGYNRLDLNKLYESI